MTLKDERFLAKTTMLMIMNFVCLYKVGFLVLIQLPIPQWQYWHLTCRYNVKHWFTIPYIP